MPRSCLLHHDDSFLSHVAALTLDNASWRNRRQSSCVLVCTTLTALTNRRARAGFFAMVAGTQLKPSTGNAEESDGADFLVDSNQ